VDRVSASLVPHYELIAELARQAPVGYIDETPWYCQNVLNWLWTMATDTVTLYLIHPNRSKEAFFDLIEDWEGLLVKCACGQITELHWQLLRRRTPRRHLSDIRAVVRCQRCRARPARVEVFRRRPRHGGPPEIERRPIDT